MQASRPIWQPLPSEWIDRALQQPNTVLLHDANPESPEPRSLLFTQPVRLIHTAHPADLHACLQSIDEALKQGFHVAGFLTYEAGVLLQGGLPHPLPANEPLLWFGVYLQPEVCLHNEQSAASATPEDTQPPEFAFLPGIPWPAYQQKIDALQRWIAAGDSYQVNYTMRLRGETLAAPSQIYQALVRQQAAGFAAVIHPESSGSIVLSCSPELFFQTDAAGTIVTKPMKGTAPRHAEAVADQDAASWLAQDEKNRAEHVMIVDLLRNDLGRICQTGSVQTSDLFRVESYATLHQMTTEVHGKLRSDLCWADIFQALFPSGSITGAPKLRTMQLIHEVEDEPRDVYTGTIGYIAPDGSSRFSVAIRTLQLRQRERQWSVTMGVGGGIVADSAATSEYAECLLKSNFTRLAAKPLQLIETMRCDAGRLRFVEDHLQRMRGSAQELGFVFPAIKIRNELEEAARQASEADAQQVRLTLSAVGETTVKVRPLQHWPEALRVRLAQSRTAIGDPTLRHKTSYRPTYDQEIDAAKQAGFQESIFSNDAGLLTEGCITSLFLLRGSRLVTPRLECGALPGVLRSTVLRHGLVDETIIPVQELETAEVLILGNSLRGFYPVESLAVSTEHILRFNNEKAAQLCRELESIFPPVPKP